MWLQTLPFSRLADRIHDAYRGDREDVKRDLGGTIGKSATSSAAASHARASHLCASVFFSGLCIRVLLWPASLRSTGRGW